MPTMEMQKSGEFKKQHFKQSIEFKYLLSKSSD